MAGVTELECEVNVCVFEFIVDTGICTSFYVFVITVFSSLLSAIVMWLVWWLLSSRSWTALGSDKHEDIEVLVLVINASDDDDGNETCAFDVDKVWSALSCVFSEEDVPFALAFHLFAEVVLECLLLALSPLMCLTFFSLFYFDVRGALSVLRLLL